MVGKRPDRFKVLGYTTEMADLMRISTLFVGKPGGLSSSECMAAGLPMVLINPIPGQEVRNSDFLFEEGVAVRCNYTRTIGYKLDMLLGDPDRMRGWRRGPGGSASPTPATGSRRRAAPTTYRRCGSRRTPSARCLGGRAGDLGRRPARRQSGPDLGRLRQRVVSWGDHRDPGGSASGARCLGAGLSAIDDVAVAVPATELRRRRADADLLVTLRRLLQSSPELSIGLA